MTSGSLWNYYRDEIDGVDDNASQDKSLEYKTKVTGKTSERPPQPGNEGDAERPLLNVDVTIPLKNLSNFWRSLDLTLMNCEIELDLSWAKDCELMEYSGILASCLFFHSKKLTVILQEVLFFKCFF